MITFEHLSSVCLEVLHLAAYLARCFAFCNLTSAVLMEIPGWECSSGIPIFSEVQSLSRQKTIVTTVLSKRTSLLTETVSSRLTTSQEKLYCLRRNIKECRKILLSTWNNRFSFLKLSFVGKSSLHAIEKMGRDNKEELEAKLGNSYLK